MAEALRKKQGLSIWRRPAWDRGRPVRSLPPLQPQRADGTSAVPGGVLIAAQPLRSTNVPLAY
jgi:hypothetical protein